MRRTVYLYSYTVFGASLVVLVPYIWLSFHFGQILNPIRFFTFQAWNIIAQPYWIAGFIGSMLLLCLNPFSKKKGSYGDAHWATRSEVKAMGMFGLKGLIIGEAFGNYLKICQNLSCLILAPPGTGKTASIAVPSILDGERSFLINDVKGELFRLTSRHRNKCTKVFRFAPASEDSCQWNPLAKIYLNGKDALVQINTIATVLYTKEDFWSMEARNAFSFFAMANIEQYGETSLASIRESSIGDTRRKIKKLLPKLSEKTKDKGKYLESKAPAEFSGILSSFQSQLQCFEDPLVANATSGNDFLFSDFRKELTTLYLCIQPKDIGRLRVLLNLFFEMATLSFLSQEHEFKEEQNSIGVTLLLDEFPQLGQLNQVIQAAALSRGMGFSTMIFAQDYAQLSRIYGSGIQDVLDGSNAYRCILPQNNIATAERISRSIGTYTRERHSVSQTKRSLGKTTSSSHEARLLITPQELLSMKENELIIIAQNNGQTPIRAKQVRWYKDRLLKKRVGELIRIID